MGFHSAHLTPKWKHMQETSMHILKKYFGFCTLTARVIFNHQVLRDSFFPLWKATFTMKQPQKLWHWVSSKHKSKRFQLINIQLFKLAFPRLFVGLFRRKMTPSSLDLKFSQSLKQFYMKICVKYWVNGVTG